MMRLRGLLPAPLRRLPLYLLAARYLRSGHDVVSLVSLLRTVGPYTIVSPASLAALHYFAKKVAARELAGDIVECGTMNGGSAAIMAAAIAKGSSNRCLWVFDSFQGLPPTTERDEDATRPLVGACVGDPVRVLEVMRKVRFPRERLRIVEGWFADTFPQAPVGQVSLLHIDCDWYDSVYLCLERFYDRISPGGFLVINDYGIWQGCRAAVDEFFAARGLKPKLHWVDPGTRYLRK